MSRELRATLPHAFRMASISSSEYSGFSESNLADLSACCFRNSLSNACPGIIEIVACGYFARRWFRALKSSSNSVGFALYQSVSLASSRLIAPSPYPTRKREYIESGYIPDLPRESGGPTYFSLAVSLALRDSRNTAS